MRIKTVWLVFGGFMGRPYKNPDDRRVPINRTVTRQCLLFLIDHAGDNQSQYLEDAIYSHAGSQSKYDQLHKEIQELKKALDKEKADSMFKDTRIKSLERQLYNHKLPEYVEINEPDLIKFCNERDIEKELSSKCGIDDIGYQHIFKLNQVKLVGFGINNSKELENWIVGYYSKKQKNKGDIK